MLKWVNQYKTACLIGIVIFIQILGIGLKTYKEQALTLEVASESSIEDDYSKQENASNQEKIENLQTTSVIDSSSQILQTKEIPVFLCGEVNKPGVYYVQSQTILNEVVALAGGFTTSADTTFENLARMVQANEKIYIPKMGEEIDKITNSYDNTSNSLPHTTTKQITNDTKTSALGQSNGKININTATNDRLQTLPGIGKVKADAIITHRETVGDFMSTQDIMNVSGIGQKTYEKIFDKITT